MFYFAPAILLQGKAFYIFLNSVTAFFGVIALSAGVMGFFLRRLSLIERFAVFGCGLLLIDPNPYTDMIAIAVLAYMFAHQRFGKPRPA